MQKRILLLLTWLQDRKWKRWQDRPGGVSERTRRAAIDRRLIEPMTCFYDIIRITDKGLSMLVKEVTPQ